MKEYFTTLVETIKGEDLKRELKENINYWREHNDWLWGSDLNKLMIDHGLQHAESLMDVLTDLVFCYAVEYSPPVKTMFRQLGIAMFIGILAFLGSRLVNLIVLYFK